MATATQDTEITLGTGKMLALFFGLVALCAVFFGMGFSLGRSSVRIASPDLPAATTVSTGGARPSAVKTTSANPPADMTFYKAVESKDVNTQPVPKEVSTSASDNTAPANRSSERRSHCTAREQLLRASGRGQQGRRRGSPGRCAQEETISRILNQYADRQAHPRAGWTVP